MKPMCYTCKHRRSSPGTAHSSCKHPDTEAAWGDPLVEAFAIFASVGRTPPMQAITKLNIKGNAIGIRRGWFNWPWNFDPTWLVNCDGCTPRAEDGDPGQT